MNRTEKAELVETLNKTFSDSAVVVVTQQVGLSVAEVTDLRRQMRDAGAGYKVTKNRLARLALKGTQYEALEEVFTGPTAIATSSDPVAPAKVAVEFANKNEKLTIVAGAMGDKLLSVEEVKALAKLPSLDELRGKLVGLLQAPATKIAGVLQAPAGQLARVLSARGSQEG
ncbi:MAG: 50S ribosomal protein L10 [Rhodospirillaceae bacterium]|nr:50S ribosomal protein L10 [Rhodospirillaceae bacterium]MBT6137018.1 50S ribosomal protein L10 [Rhodospirillaceae bacterium]